MEKYQVVMVRHGESVSNGTNKVGNTSVVRAKNVLQCFCPEHIDILGEQGILPVLMFAEP